MGAGASRQCGAFWEDSSRQCKNIFGVEEEDGNPDTNTSTQPQLDEQGHPKVPEVAGAVEGEPVPGEGGAAPPPARAQAAQAAPQRTAQQQQQQQGQGQRQQQQQQQRQQRPPQQSQAQQKQPPQAQPQKQRPQVVAPSKAEQPGLASPLGDDVEPGAFASPADDNEDSYSEYGGQQPIVKTKTPKSEDLTSTQRAGLMAVANIFSGRPSDAQEPGLTPAEQKKLTSFKVKAINGAMFLFYKSSGPPVESRVKLDWEAAELSWDKPKSMLSSNNMRLREGFEVLSGKATKIMTKKERAYVEDELCLSVVTKKGSVDLQCHASAQRDEWVWGLNRLLEDLPKRKDMAGKLWKSAGRLKALGRFGSPEVVNRKLAQQPGAR